MGGPTKVSSSSQVIQDLSNLLTHHMQYHGFATGLPKSRNCTTFLIGKTSALTLADCVYNSSTGSWTCGEVETVTLILNR